MKKRWMKTVIETGKKTAPTALPFHRGVRAAAAARVVALPGKRTGTA